MTVTSQWTLMADREETLIVYVLPLISRLSPLIDHRYCLPVTWRIFFVGAWHVKLISLSTQISPFRGRLTEMIIFIFGSRLFNPLLLASCHVCTGVCIRCLMMNCCRYHALIPQLYWEDFEDNKFCFFVYFTAASKINASKLIESI